MKKKGILLALLVLALTLTAAVATAECAHEHWHWENDQTTHWKVCDDCGETFYQPLQHRSTCTAPDTCATCGATGIVPVYVDHPNTHYEYNHEVHWYVCDDCGESHSISGPLAHTEDCTNPGVCAFCGATDVIFAETSHSRTHKEYDQTSHWEVCDNCGEITSWGKWAHYNECSDPERCAFCGATGVTFDHMGHDGIWEWHVTETTHEAVCSLCGGIAEEAEEHYASCGSPDKCSYCEATGVTIAHVYHSDFTHWEHDQYTHWRVCDDCGETIEGPDSHIAECTAPNECAVCHATGVYLGLDFQHNNTHYEYDNEHHWEVCDDCGERLSIVGYSHYDSCLAPGVCVICGAPGVEFGFTDHPNARYEHDQTTCWIVCDDCGFVGYPLPHTASCTNPDVCDSCGSTGVTIGYVGHGITHHESDETSHWDVCEDCGEIAFGPEAHYTDEGDPAGVCSYCHEAYTGSGTDTPTTPPTDTVAINSVTVSGDLNVGNILTATIDATGATAYSFWVYDANNQLIHEIYMYPSNSLRFTLPNPGGYIVFAAATNGELTATANSGWFVVKGDQVVITRLSILGTQEVGSAMTAKVVSPTATAYSYWLYDGNATLLEEVYMTSSNTYTFTPEKPGIYNVFVAVTDGATGAQANTGWFPVKGDPVVINSLTITGDKTPGSPLTATIDTTGSTGFSYWFYNADGTLLEEAYMVTTSSYTFTPAVAGGYNIFVAVTDGVSGDQENSGWFMVE